VTAYLATNAASSGVRLDKKVIKGLSKRSDRPGLIWLGLWAAMLVATGSAVYLTLASWWVVPAMIAYGTVLTLPSYALSHECAHGTAFRSRWLNEALFWLASLIYFEEPYHRRYSHTRHHSYTWIRGRDSQMPFATPMTFSGWLLEVPGLGLILTEVPIFLRNALGLFSEEVRDFAPESEFPKLKWGARACLAIYGTLAAIVVAGHWWPVTFLLIPRLVGGPVMLLFTLLQHVELEENQTSILNSTRSFKTNWLGRFLYMNMNNHVEHHLYPMVPFHQLEQLKEAIADQLPAPDAGFLRGNWEVLVVAVRRSLGLSTKAPSLRQAPQMIAAAVGPMLAKEDAL
jgi:fatty acid desaturase